MGEFYTKNPVFENRLQSQLITVFYSSDVYNIYTFVSTNILNCMYIVNLRFVSYLEVPSYKQSVASSKIKIISDVQLKNLEELHLIQMENERKRSRNLDLEYEILKEKKNQIKKRLGGMYVLISFRTI